jgi:aldehyde dehydrogenase (NAD+)
MATTGLGEPRQLIDGKLVDASSGRVFDNINPAIAASIGVTTDAGPEDLDAAIGAARRAFDEGVWSDDRARRKACLTQLVNALAHSREELREILVAEAGSPVMLTHFVQVDGPIDDAGYWLDLMDRYHYERDLGERSQYGLEGRRFVVREPVGVVGAITPWNFPLFLNLAKLMPALAAGCSVVLKPAPDTPWAATVLGRLVAEQTDIPPGVVNVVASSDHAIGQRLVADPRVDMITFTGSTATGRSIMATAAPSVKKLFLELGGKSANIVLDDADFEEQVPGAAGMCFHAGQGCVTPTRMLVPRSRYEECVELAGPGFESLPYGDPTDPGNIMGPVVSAKQRDRVMAYIAKGVEEGARLVTGGALAGDRGPGYYIQPTLFADVDSQSTIAQEEIFGPVLVMIPFEDDDDAVRIANDTIYGLGGAVTSADPERALAVARRLRAGTVSVNGAGFVGPDVPFGGYKQSGLGREWGSEGFDEYHEVKTIGMPV